LLRLITGDEPLSTSVWGRAKHPSLEPDTRVIVVEGGELVIWFVEVGSNPKGLHLTLVMTSLVFFKCLGESKAPLFEARLKGDS